MKRILVFFLASFLTVIPSFAFQPNLHVDSGNHGFYTSNLSSNRPFCNLLTDADSTNQAAEFALLNLESLTIADNASLSLSTDSNYTWAGWFYSTATLGSTRTFFRKGNDTLNNNDIEYKLNFQSTNRWVAFIGNGTTSTSVSADTFGDLSTNTWYFVVVIHDKDADLLKISVNNGTFDTVAWSNGTVNSTTGLNVGVDSTTQYISGRVDSLGFWKDTILNATQITQLYNAGVGRRYCQLSDSSLLNGLTAWWEMGEASGTRLDSTANNNDLTDNNTVTQNSGITTEACVCP